MRLVFFGTPEFAVPTLEAVARAGHDIPLVVSRPDQPAGRGMRVTVPAVVEAARRLGLSTTQPEKLGTDEFINRLRVIAPEVAVVVAFGRLISPRVLRVPARGFLNLHPSLLPRHRGPSPIAWALASGDAETGATIMQLDEGMDTGPVLLQRRVPIGAKDRTPDLEARLAVIGAELMVEALDRLLTGGLTPVPQDNAKASVTPKLERKTGKVDWSCPARRLADLCRALDPWPGMYANFRGIRVKVHGIEAAAPRAGQEVPGTVLAVSGAGIEVRCGEGSVALLTELQREGKRRLPADAFIIGERVAPGEHFT
ncbi:MAG: methionyl-tRNA formyltransferase [Acidobacteriota bacterium]